MFVECKIKFELVLRKNISHHKQLPHSDMAENGVQVLGKNSLY